MAWQGNHVRGTYAPPILRAYRPDRLRAVSRNSITNMKTYTATIEGIRPLICNNGRMANPLEEIARRLKTITSKKQKTEDDYRLMCQLNWRGSLYWSDEIGVYMPTENLQRMLLDAAKKVKLGRQVVGLIVAEEIGAPLQFENSRNLAKLEGDSRYHFVKMAKRPKPVLTDRLLVPTGWRLEFSLQVDQTIFPEDRIGEILEIGGNIVGLGDWRPGAPMVPGNMGRFKLVEVTES